jgi:hypothetical protein
MASSPASTGPVATPPGISFVSAEVGAKQLGLLRELQSGVARIAVVVDPKWPITEPFVSQVRTAASAMGQQIDVLYVSSGSEIETAFTTLRPTWGWRAARGHRRVHGLPTSAAWSFLTCTCARAKRELTRWQKRR